MTSRACLRSVLFLSVGVVAGFGGASVAAQDGSGEAAAQPADAEPTADAEASQRPTPALDASASEEQRTRQALEQEARRLFDEGREAYERGAFEQALRLFEKARDLAEPRARVFLEFNIAQTLDRLGRDEEALRRYEAYLKEAPDGPRAGASFRYAS